MENKIAVARIMARRIFVTTERDDREKGEMKRETRDRKAKRQELAGKRKKAK